MTTQHRLLLLTIATMTFIFAAARLYTARVALQRARGEVEKKYFSDTIQHFQRAQFNLSKTPADDNIRVATPRNEGDRG